MTMYQLLAVGLLAVVFTCAFVISTHLHKTKQRSLERLLGATLDVIEQWEGQPITHRHQLEHLHHDLRNCAERLRVALGRVPDDAEAQQLEEDVANMLNWAQQVRTAEFKYSKPDWREELTKKLEEIMEASKDGEPPTYH